MFSVGRLSIQSSMEDYGSWQYNGGSPERRASVQSYYSAQDTVDNGAPARMARLELRVPEPSTSCRSLLLSSTPRATVPNLHGHPEGVEAAARGGLGSVAQSPLTSASVALSSRPERLSSKAELALDLWTYTDRTQQPNETQQLRRRFIQAGIESSGARNRGSWEDLYSSRILDQSRQEQFTIVCKGSEITQQPQIVPLPHPQPQPQQQPASTGSMQNDATSLDQLSTGKDLLGETRRSTALTSRTMRTVEVLKRSSVPNRLLSLSALLSAFGVCSVLASGLSLSREQVLFEDLDCARNDNGYGAEYKSEKIRASTESGGSEEASHVCTHPQTLPSIDTEDPQIVSQTSRIPVNVSSVSIPTVESGKLIRLISDSESTLIGTAFDENSKDAGASFAKWAQRKANGLYEWLLDDEGWSDSRYRNVQDRLLRSAKELGAASIVGDNVPVFFGNVLRGHWLSAGRAGDTKIPSTDSPPTECPIVIACGSRSMESNSFIQRCVEDCGVKVLWLDVTGTNSSSGDVRFSTDRWAADAKAALEFVIANSESNGSSELKSSGAKAKIFLYGEGVLGTAMLALAANPAYSGVICGAIFQDIVADMDDLTAQKLGATGFLGRKAVQLFGPEIETRESVRALGVPALFLHSDDARADVCQYQSNDASNDRSERVGGRRKVMFDIFYKCASRAKQFGSASNLNIKTLRTFFNNPQDSPADALWSAS